MNTVRSFWLGWGSLVVAGAGAYVFAKKSINADRQARFEADQKKKRAMAELEYNSVMAQQSQKGDTQYARHDSSGSPSSEASSDPAPTSHAPSSETQRVFEKSKYEASEPWRAPKGNRLG